MNPEEKAYWRRVMARAKSTQPGMDRALQAFLEDVRKLLAPAVVTDFIANNDVDRMVSLLLSDDALELISKPLTRQIFQQLDANVGYFARSIPKEGALKIGFDVQNPRHIEGVRTIDTKVVQRLKADVRDAVRQHAEDGLRNAVGPRKIGRELRQVVGLAPSQLQEVENFRQALENHDVDRVLSYKRRDSRFDSRVMSGKYGAAEIDKWTERYRDRRVAWNAETVARTATLDGMKQGERLTWETAVDQKLIDRDRLMKEWLGVMDMRERPAHRLMQKQKRHFDELFSNGELIPGTSTHNCRCLARYYEERAARRAGVKRTSVGAPPLGLPSIPPVPPIPPVPTPTPISSALTNAQRLKQSLETIEAEIVQHKVEHAAVFQADGTMLFRKTSNRKNAVAFGTSELAQFADAVVTHNHPSGTWGLSDADVKVAMQHNVAEMRAATVDQVCSITRPATGWDASTWNRTARLFRATQLQLRAEWSPLARSGLMTVADYQQRFYHELWTRVAQATGLDYRSESRIP